MEPNTAEPLSRTEVEGLRDSLTMLDIYRARKTTKESVEVGLVAYFEAAKRTALVGKDSTLEDFLGRLGADDFNEIMGAQRTDPKLSGGENGPASYDGTDTPPPNS